MPERPSLGDKLGRKVQLPSPSTCPASHLARLPRLFRGRLWDGASKPEPNLQKPSCYPVSLHLLSPGKFCPSETGGLRDNQAHKSRPSQTLQFPSFALFLFGNDFHVFVVYVVLTQKAVDPAIHEIYGCKEKGGKRPDLIANVKVVLEVTNETSKSFRHFTVYIISLLLNHSTHLLQKD